MLPFLDKLIRGDYIPDGPQAREATNLRESPGGYRCGVSIGNNLQSGPLYCGVPAAWIADEEDEIAAVCERHKRNLIRIIKDTTGSDDACGLGA